MHLYRPALQTVTREDRSNLTHQDREYLEAWDKMPTEQREQLRQAGITGPQLNRTPRPNLQPRGA